MIALVCTYFLFLQESYHDNFSVLMRSFAVTAARQVGQMCFFVIETKTSLYEMKPFADFPLIPFLVFLGGFPILRYSWTTEPVAELLLNLLPRWLALAA